MKKMPPRRTVYLVAATALLSACGQSQTTSYVSNPETKVEQNAWAQLTANADTELKDGNKAKAEQSYMAAIIEAKKLGVESPAQGDAIANLANFYYAQGAGAQADQLYTSSLALHEKILGMEHVDLTADLIGLARIRSSEKKYAEASALYKRAIAILKRSGRKIPPTLEVADATMQKLSTSGIR